MTTEEKAKAYDEALEWMREIYPTMEGFVREDAEHYFPELKESEDERIREFLIDLLSHGTWKKDWPFSPAECVAWLKKQKDINCLACDEHLKGYLAGRKVTEEEKQKEQNDDEGDFTIYHPQKNGEGNYECIPFSFYGSLTAFSNDKDLMDFLNECFYDKEECERWCEVENKPELPECKHKIKKDSVFDYLCESSCDEKQKEHSMSAEEVLTRAGLKPYKDGNQWCILAGDNIQEGICGFGDTIDEALYQFLMEVLENQKEQKPIEIHIDNPNIEKFDPDVKITTSDSSADGVKSIEWSEEDEKTINNACCWIAEYAGYLMDKNYSKASMLMSLTDKLKSLRPQSHCKISDELDINTLHDWSMRFAPDIREAIEATAYHFYNISPQPHTISIKDATKFGNLEYERGVKDGIQHSENHRWKPSEEQIYSLGTVVKGYDNCTVGSVGYNLKELYNNLKTLM